MNPFSIFGTPLYDSRIVSRSITADNPTGVRAADVVPSSGRPFLSNIKAGESCVLASITGPGVIRRIWMAVENRTPAQMRNYILRIYWRGQAHPSVEVPLADFFGAAHGMLRPVATPFYAVNAQLGMTSYFVMPISTDACITLANEGEVDSGKVAYQVDYTLGDPVDGDTPRFHAQFRSGAARASGEFVILDGVQGRGRYLGALVGLVRPVAQVDTAWSGAVRIVLDGEEAYPVFSGLGATVCAEGGEGAGVFQQLDTDFAEGGRISCCRFHGYDPIYFDRSVEVALQQADADTICATAFWYQTLPTSPFPDLPDRAVRSAGVPEA